MKIDRHNYEAYFILYWDKELTATQELAVKNFVQENADLQDEFRVFGETRFAPEATIQFDDKNFLLNNAAVNITNLEEQLLNYIDDELSTGEKESIEKYAGLYPSVKKELELLQKTKLQAAPEIVFDDKSVLYRREEKVRIISMTWFRVAVAAAIIIIAGFATLRFLNTGKADKDIAPIVKADGQNNSPANKEINPPAVLPKDEAQQDNIDKQTAASTEKKEKEIKKLPVENMIAGSLAVNKVENKNNLPKEGSGLQNKSNPDANNADAAYTAVDLPNLKQKDYTTAAEKYSNEANAAVTIQPGYALNLQQPVVYEKEKGGIKEFLRKTTRLFERRTKIQATTDDNKLLVGAFAVSLK